METTIREEGRWTVVAVNGRIDTLTSEDLNATCLPLLDKDPPRMILELSGVDYLSSAGIRSLILLGQTADEKGGEFCLCGVKGVVEEVLDACNVTKIIPVYPGVNEVLANKDT